MLRRGRSFAFVVSLCSLVLLAPVDAFLQTQQAAVIKGVVTDADGALVPGATVVLKHMETGSTSGPVVTNSRGEYTFSGLAAGRYKVVITLAGFKTVEMDVVVGAAAAVTIPTRLELGKREEVMNVRASSEILRLDTPTVSATVNAEFIQTLPRADRNALNFLIFQPGVQGAGRNATISGLPANTINVTIDGVSQNNLLQSKDGFYSLVVPRLDATSEVTLITASAGADATGQGAVQIRSVQGTETFTRIVPSRFNIALDQPLSTFGADVDTASYTIARRYLTEGRLPPSEAIRVEEFVNYFRFGYTPPRANEEHPLSLTTEIGNCPWAPNHKLVLIGARAANPRPRESEGRNIVLLVDVSGSMSPAQRLPMLKSAFGLFVDSLRPDDIVSIVTYAGSSGVALWPTRARQRDVIQNAIAQLGAGGSTNGAQGIAQAYDLARRSFIRGGINRVILATDGDFNVGVTSQEQLLALIEHERQSGVFLSVLGVGDNNLKDQTMEMLADKGNGNYAYLDSLQEARRVLVREMDATLETVAKDVKFQVEFNPAMVVAWRLIGYENRALAAKDFNDDRKDAGEVGAGHTVTMLYEIVPADIDRPLIDTGRPDVDALRYQPRIQPVSLESAQPVTVRGEWLTVKARYKRPDSDTSQLLSASVRDGGRVEHLPLAAAIADFGLILRDMPRNQERWDDLVRRLERLNAPPALASDVTGLRELVATASGLARLRKP